MAVTTTPQDILEAAYAKSLKNRAGTIATETTELLQVVIRALRGLYAFAARINPAFFGDTATVAEASGWPRPPGAESVFRIEFNASPNAEVVVVPFDDRTAEEGLPAVYSFGQYYQSAGNALDPTTEALDFYYAKRPDDPASVTATIDPLWVEQFNELLILEVAIYLAQKDLGESGRADELKVLMADRDRWLNLFVAHLEHETANERRRSGHVRRFNTNWMVPLNSLVAGGTSLQFNQGGGG
jgi:hypothetical protein